MLLLKAFLGFNFCFRQIVSRNKRIHHKTAQNLQSSVRLFQLNETCVKIAKLLQHDLYAPAPADHRKHILRHFAKLTFLHMYQHGNIYIQGWALNAYKK